MSKPLALDLCSGAGGMTIGLEAAGYRTIGFDNWQPAVDTHHANGLECHRSDLMAVGDAVWQSFAGRVDLIVGGPPCQPFSAAGLGRGEWDPRDAIPGFIRAVRLVQPRAFVMENVRGLTFAKHAHYLAAVLDGFREAGYDVEHRVLNAADYGVPQTRQRLFVIGRRDGEPIVWPEPTHVKLPAEGSGLLPWVTMAQALGWGMTERPSTVPATSEDDAAGWQWRERRNDQTGTDEVDRDWPLERPSTTVATRDLIPDPGANANRFNGKAKSRNDGIRVEPDEAATLQGFPMLNTGRAWLKGGDRSDAQTLSTTQPAPTVPAVSSQWQWQTEAGDRSLVAPAQLAILQAFPRGYVFTGNRTTVFRQIGNACPPMFAYVIAKANAGAALTAEAVA